jgi:hypothetical protein
MLLLDNGRDVFTLILQWLDYYELVALKRTCRALYRNEKLRNRLLDYIETVCGGFGPDRWGVRQISLVYTGSQPIHVLYLMNIGKRTGYYVYPTEQDVVSAAGRHCEKENIIQITTLADGTIQWKTATGSIYLLKI